MAKNTPQRKQGIYMQVVHELIIKETWLAIFMEGICYSLSIDQPRFHILSFLKCISFTLLFLTLRSIVQRMLNYSHYQPGTWQLSVRCPCPWCLHFVWAMAVITSVELLCALLVLHMLVPHAKQCHQGTEIVPLLRIEEKKCQSPVTDVTDLAELLATHQTIGM